jgi:hypothetical protein
MKALAPLRVCECEGRQVGEGRCWRGGRGGAERCGWRGKKGEGWEREKAVSVRLGKRHSKIVTAHTKKEDRRAPTLLCQSCAGAHHPPVAQGPAAGRRTPAPSAPASNIEHCTPCCPVCCPVCPPAAPRRRPELRIEGWRPPFPPGCLTDRGVAAARKQKCAPGPAARAVVGERIPVCAAQGGSRTMAQKAATRAIMAIVAL